MAEIRDQSPLKLQIVFKGNWRQFLVWDKIPYFVAHVAVRDWQVTTRYCRLLVSVNKS